MEEYHKVRKTGLKTEDLRFGTKQRLETAILSVVAVRMLNLRWSRESCPEAPATVIASAEEIEAVESLKPGKPVVTVKQFVDRVGRAGRVSGPQVRWPTGLAKPVAWLPTPRGHPLGHATRQTAGLRQLHELWDIGSPEGPGRSTPDSSSEGASDTSQDAHFGASGKALKPGPSGPG